MRLFALFCVFSSALSWCQKPVIFPGGVVNAASYGPGLPSNGSIASIFGTNLAACTQAANTIPVPTEICGTSVGCSPLLYVSPNQINFQVGAEASCTPPSPGSAFVVTTTAGNSDPYVFEPPFGSQSAIFTADASGCGQGAVLNVHTDGTTSVNSPSNSAAPGDYISIFGTGDYVPSIPYGVPAPSNPPAQSGAGASWFLDFRVPLTGVAWSGAAPGLIGVDQANVQLPAIVREGCAVPLQLSFGDIGNSQPVTISIHQGGGQCVDPSSAGNGQITWEKTITTPASGTPTETDTLTVSLQASPGRQAPPPPPGAPFEGFELWYFGPSCSIPGYRSLDAGAITAAGPGLASLSIPLIPMSQSRLISAGGGNYIQQSQASGLKVYQGSLPVGAIQPGSYSVSGAGGADIGAFQSSVQIGSGIQVTTPIAGQTFSALQPLTINWTGGDPNTIVTLRILPSSIGALAQPVAVRAKGTDHTLTLGTVNGLLPGGAGDSNAVFTLEVTPDASQVTSFQAPGLSLGGQHTWKYIYRFEGVNPQQQLSSLVRPPLPLLPAYHEPRIRVQK